LRQPLLLLVQGLTAARHCCHGPLVCCQTQTALAAAAAAVAAAGSKLLQSLEWPQWRRLQALLVRLHQTGTLPRLAAAAAVAAAAGFPAAVASW
jgi:hypothetical protein